MEGKTTIQIDISIKKKLENLKLSKRDTFNEVIENLLEDSTELIEKTKKEIEEAMNLVSHGEYVTQDRVKKELGL